MIARPENVSFLGRDLDHPECVCVGPEGAAVGGKGKGEKEKGKGQKGTAGRKNGEMSDEAAV